MSHQNTSYTFQSHGYPFVLLTCAQFPLAVSQIRDGVWLGILSKVFSSTDMPFVPVKVKKVTKNSQIPYLHIKEAG